MLEQNNFGASSAAYRNPNDPLRDMVQSVLEFSWDGKIVGFQPNSTEKTVTVTFADGGVATYNLNGENVSM